MIRLVLLALVLGVAMPTSTLAGWTAPADVPRSKDGVLSRVAMSTNGTVAVAWADAKLAVRRRVARWHPVRAMHRRETTATSPDVAFAALAGGRP